MSNAGRIETYRLPAFSFFLFSLPTATALTTANQYFFSLFPTFFAMFL